MSQPEAQPWPQVPRFIAPHFIEIEGSADIPGAIQRACAFTTAAPGWPRNRDGATHYHRCTLTSDTGRWKDGGAVGWRTESWPVVSPGRSTEAGERPSCLLPPTSAPVVANGHAEDLMQAIASALGAAYSPLPGTLEAPEGGLVQCVAPAFVEMSRESGLPRIWLCSHLNAQGTMSPEQPWTHLQTVLVREWPGGSGPGRFQVEVETLPFAAIIPTQAAAGSLAAQPMRWWANDLEAAMAEALARLYGTGRAARRLGADFPGGEAGTG